MSPQNPTSQQDANLIETELQHNIPVQPHVPNDKNPIAGVKQFVEQDNKHDDGLEQVLNDVSASVKESDKKNAKKPLFSFLKKKKVDGVKPAVSLSSPGPSINNPTQQEENPENQIAKKEEKAKVPKPILAAVVAIFIATGLSAAAVYAFNQNKDVYNKLQTAKTTTTQPQAASRSTQLTVNDLNDFSSTLDSNFNSLNDAQDFNEADISDASLGL
jgi:hypothetical protein